MSRFIRQSHRWIAFAFMLVVIANFIALGFGYQAEWLYYLPLPPLFLLMASGIYLWVLPYLSKRRA
jgi:hypothetical protein